MSQYPQQPQDGPYPQQPRNPQQPVPAPLPSDAEAEARELAFKRVKARRDLGAHAVTYLVVNTFLIGVWFMSGGGYFWPAWVLGGWGIGLALNAWDVLFRRPITEADIQREMRRG